MVDLLIYIIIARNKIKTKSCYIPVEGALVGVAEGEFDVVLSSDDCTILLVGSCVVVPVVLVSEEENGANDDIDGRNDGGVLGNDETAAVIDDGIEEVDTDGDSDGGITDGSELEATDGNADGMVDGGDDSDSARLGLGVSVAGLSCTSA